MKFLYGLSAALLGSTLLAGAATAADNDHHVHPHFRAGEQPAQTPSAPPRGNHAPSNVTPGGWAAAHGYRGGNGNASAPPRPLNNNSSSFAANNGGGNSNPGWNWQRGRNGGPPPQSPPRNNAAPGNNNNAGWAATHGYNGGRYNRGSHPHWNANTLRDHNVSHWSANNRSTWQHGRWSHGRHNGRNGWWWYSGGTYFFYDQPVYPYPGYVSNYYYDDDSYYDDGGYDGYDDPGYGAEPGDNGYYWYYCDNPAGYYPYVKSCRGPWRAVTPTPDPQQAYDQSGPDDQDQGPPPGYDDQSQPPRDQYDGPDDDDRGPPPGADNGPYDDEDGPPPR